MLCDDSTSYAGVNDYFPTEAIMMLDIVSEDKLNKD